MRHQAAIADTPRTTTISVGLQIAAALLLGLVILAGTGFSSSASVHNAAHDVRHALGFPCH